jgi:hypothetical protein
MMGRRVFQLAGEYSTPSPWSAVAAEPALVACPIPVSAFGACSVAVHDVYRMAYEAALRAAKPSLYERASAVCWN